MKDSLSQINEASWYIEPAVHFMIYMSGDNSLLKYLPENLEIINAPLYWFTSGMNSYFNVWVHTKELEQSLLYNKEFESIELSLLKSILCSTFNKNNNLIKNHFYNYRDGNILRKIETANSIVKALKNLPKPDAKSKDPENSFNRYLVAAWSSTWLTNHYWEAQRLNLDKYEPLKDLMNELIEIPVRSLGGRIRSMNGEQTYLTPYI